MLNYDSESWGRKGGLYGIPLLDGILQLLFLIPVMDIGCITFAGGFDVGIFARKPSEKICFAHVETINPIQENNATAIGNASLYDSKGHILAHIKGIKVIFTQKISHVEDTLQIWQPMSSVSISKPPKVADLQEIREYISNQIFKVIEFRYKASKCNIACMRVLECVEQQSDILRILDSLMFANERGLPNFPFLVEVFIATHDDIIANERIHIPLKHRRWLKTRKILLPSAQPILHKFQFDAIGVWGGIEGPSKYFSTHEFLLDIGKISNRGCIIFHDSNFDRSCGNYVHRESDVDGIFISRPDIDAILRDQTTSGDVLILSHNLSAASALCHSLQCKTAEFKSKWNASILSWEDKQVLQDKLEYFLKSNPDHFKHIVFLNCFDSSKYGRKSFVEIARTAKILGLSSLGGDVEAHTWIITSEVFSGRINIDQSSLVTLSNSISAEFKSISSKFVDLEDPLRNFDALATLIVQNAGCEKNMIDRNNLMHEYRLVPFDYDSNLGQTASYHVSSDDPEYHYRCEMFLNRQNGKV